jgi:hypothetical protein
VEKKCRHKFGDNVKLDFKFLGWEVWAGFRRLVMGTKLE